MFQHGRTALELYKALSLESVETPPDACERVFRSPARVQAIHDADAVEACDTVIDLLAVFFNVSGRQLRSPKRTSAAISRVRQVGMYVAHVSLGIKMAMVGTGFGRDRSTVMHACHTIEDLREDDDFDLVVARFDMLVQVAFTLHGRGGRR